MDQRIPPERERPNLRMPTSLLLDVKSGMLTYVIDPDGIDDDTARVLTARNVTNVTGQCPACGARVVLPNRAARRKAKRAAGGQTVVIRATVEHEDGCPAADTAVPQADHDAIAAWFA